MSCLASSERLYLLTEELYTPKLYLPKFSVEVPRVSVLVDELVEILLCEGGDVELCARTSKHILVFAFDLSLSLILCLASFILLIHIYMLGCVCLCASLMFNQESFI